MSISNVTSDRLTIEDLESEVNISYRLSAVARVSLKIYDPYNNLVRTVRSESSLPPGGHTLSWDGRDDAGNAVTPEAYVYTLTAHSGSQSVVFDLSDASGGETVHLSGVTHDTDTGLVHFDLPKPARIFLRVGVENGFVLKTLVNNEVYEPGSYALAWDGFDKSASLFLRDHPRLRFYGEGYRLSRNSIIVKREMRKKEPEHRSSKIVKREKTKRPKGLNLHAYHPVALCRDVNLLLDLPEGFKRDENGVPVLTTETPFRVAIDPADQRLLESERSEIVFFMGNQLLYENEVSYFPYTWKWQPKGFGDGIYHMTAFVVSFNEHFGFSTFKFKFDQAANGSSK